MYTSYTYRIMAVTRLAYSIQRGTEALQRHNTNWSTRLVWLPAGQDCCACVTKRSAVRCWPACSRGGGVCSHYIVSRARTATASEIPGTAQY